MRQGTLVRTGLAVIFALLLLPSAGSARSALGTFPPGYWCAYGKAPAGLVIQIKSVKVTVQKGSLNFDLNASKGGAHGSWESVIGTNGITTPLAKATGQYALDGDGDLAGTTVHPKTEGSWHITGRTFVKGPNGKTVEVPFDTKTTKWSTELVIDFAGLDRVTGHWFNPRWKWTATRAKKGCG